MRPVAMVGYMGSGKSTVGRELALLTDRRFIDLDACIEERAGRSIPEIFTEFGEEGFREIEHAELKSTLLEGGVVVACGGGVVEDGRNRLLLAGADVVFLREEVDTLYRRTRGGYRPLRGGTREEFAARYRRRLPLYREVAEVEVECGGRTPREIAREVAGWLSE